MKVPFCTHQESVLNFRVCSEMSCQLCSLSLSLSKTLPIETVHLQNLIERKIACKVQWKYIFHVSKCQPRESKQGLCCLQANGFVVTSA